ncbi:helix-turn-helix domain-containing protein [Bacillus testis]|uniref:helix-turn-helix domain-containing protein n=1 Tax=Bacillus testis TaxID=1622072 RepID=UPI00067F0542|nr:helix-turn-helix transcriptional regulator [Bacillus testis]
MSEIGRKIYKYREEKAISVQELALKVRCGTKTIEEYEKGTLIPNVQTLMKLSTALDVPATELADAQYHKTI